MPKERVLLIEDEPKVALFIKQGLEENGFEVHMAHTGKAGLDLLQNTPYALVLLDLNIPVINGFEVCRQLRASGLNTPVLMLTALDATEDKLMGFEHGADDYLVKPFEFRELVARIRALLKRSANNQWYGHELQIADLVLNSYTKTVKRNGKPIELTAKEFALLELLMRNKTRVFSRAEIAKSIWDINFDTGTNIIDVYINFLRKK